MPENKKHTTGKLHSFSDHTLLQKAYNDLLVAHESLKKNSLNTTGLLNNLSYTSIYNCVNESIFFLNSENKYIDANSAASLLSGYDISKILILSERDLIENIRKHDGRQEQPGDSKKRYLADLIKKDGTRLICEYKSVEHIGDGVRLVILSEFKTGEPRHLRTLPESPEITNILDSITDIFFSVDKNWNITQWNSAAEKFFNYSKAQCIGKSLEILDAELLMPGFKEALKKSIAEKAAGVFETFFASQNQWFEIAIYPSHEGISMYFRNVSEQKKTEEALRAGNERYDIVAKATSDCVWDWDLDANLVVRPGNLLETFLGYDELKPEAVDDFWKTHVHPEDWDNIRIEREKIFNDPTKNYWEDEYRFLKPDGSYSFIYDRGYILRDANGKAIRMIGASRDITSEKQQVNEVLRIQQNLHSLINTTTDLVWSIDTEYKLLTANKAFRDLLWKFTGRELRDGDNILLTIPAEKQKGDWRTLYSRSLNGENFSIDEKFEDPENGRLWYACTTLRPIIDSNGKISGVACYTKDITDLKMAGIRLEELNRSLEKRAEELVTSNTELEHFAYVASHDLQEPLRMISGFLRLLKKNYEGKLDPRADSYIHYSVDGAERMKQLINDLLQYSRVGTSEKEIMNVNMNEVMGDILHTFQNEIKKSGAVINVGKLPSVEAGMSAMSQLLQNLLGNALKYRRDVNPVISLTAIETNTAWQFTMEDNGIGLEQKFGEKIFVIFQRLHQKDEYTGTGIGLAICRKIVERYHGKIWVESTPGIGSKFIFTIPRNSSKNS